MTDRHREKTLSLRLGAERERLEAYARTAGQPVRRIIADAVKAWLDQHERPGPGSSANFSAARSTPESEATVSETGTSAREG